MAYDPNETREEQYIRIRKELGLPENWPLHYSVNVDSYAGMTQTDVDNLYSWVTGYVDFVKKQSADVQANWAEFRKDVLAKIKK